MAKQGKFENPNNLMPPAGTPVANTSIKQGKTNSVGETPLPTAMAGKNTAGISQPSTPTKDMGPAGPAPGPAPTGQPAAPNYEGRDGGKPSNKLG